MSNVDVERENVVHVEESEVHVGEAAEGRDPGGKLSMGVGTALDDSISNRRRTSIMYDC